MKDALIALLVVFIVYETKSWFPKLLEGLIKLATLRLPADKRSEFQEEWLALLDEFPGAIAKLWHASTLLFNAGKMFSKEAVSASENAARRRHQFIIDDPISARVIDRVRSILLLIIAGPLLLLIAIGIFLSSRGPLLVKQTRIGRGGKPFTIYKFRTLETDAEQRLERLLKSCPASRFEWARYQKLRFDPRVHPFGDFLRKSSLDELPQLFNVLAGDMSLVGPRPIEENEIQKYGRYFEHYCALRPGITGLWQMGASDDISYRRRIAFDVIYARKGRVADILKILLRTIPIVLAAKGFY